LELTNKILKNHADFLNIYNEKPQSPTLIKGEQSPNHEKLKNVH